MDSAATISCSCHSFGIAEQSRSVLLTIVFGDQTQVRSLGAHESFRIGRGEGSDLLLSDPSLSRCHARFWSTGSAIYVEDLDSHNGTRVNGTRVRRAALGGGDRVTLGRAVVFVHGSRGSAPKSLKDLASSVEPAEGIPVRTSAAMKSLHERLVRLAAYPLPVLVTGETGTGKELVAKELHGLGPWRTLPLVVVNCAAIPSQLIESILFGHVRGSFTGANRAHVGVFESSRGGTVFLDEIGELALPTQAALLRVIETHQVQPIGSNRSIHVGFRVVAATHRDLNQMVVEGKFREDLYHRLNGVTLTVPPLRDRRDEIPHLVDYFLTAIATRERAQKRRLSENALALLDAYGWPGNVRELRNVVEHAVALSDEDPIQSEALPPTVRDGGVADRSDEGPGSSGFDLRTAVHRREVELIREALDISDGNQRKAAALLSIPLRTFERKLQRLNRPECAFADDAK